MSLLSELEDSRGRSSHEWSPREGTLRGLWTRCPDPGRRSEIRRPKSERRPRSEIRGPNGGDVPEDAKATFAKASARQGEFNSSSALILR